MMTNVLIANTAIFISVAFLHALRLIEQSQMIIGEVSLPLWLSWLGVTLGGTMALLNWRAVPEHGKQAVLKLLLSLVVIDMLAVLYSWIANLSYWGFSGNAFLWAALFDAAVIAALWYFLNKKTSKIEK